jgi:Thioesterase superfamily
LQKYYTCHCEGASFAPVAIPKRDRAVSTVVPRPGRLPRRFAPRNDGSPGSSRTDSMTNAIFSLPIRVYYEDTDTGGVVYYANYLKFMERARTEWLRSFGVIQDELSRTQGVLFAVRSARVDYLKP